MTYLVTRPPAVPRAVSPSRAAPRAAAVLAAAVVLSPTTPCHRLVAQAAPANAPRALTAPAPVTALVTAPVTARRTGAGDSVRADAPRTVTVAPSPGSARAIHRAHRARVAPIRPAGPRVVIAGRAVTFAYSPAEEPVVTCAVLRACVVELEPGESLAAEPLRGDAVRWRVDTASAGPGGAVKLVWAKPTDCDLTTNLVVSTDRRVYHLLLDSGPCGRGGSATNPQAPFASRVTFTYPDAGRRLVAGGAPNGPTGAGAPYTLASARGGDAYGAYGPAVAGARRPELAGIAVDVTRLNAQYGVRRERGFPWEPSQVFDDGVHTFIRVPAGAAAYAAPALFVLGDGGAKEVLNYTVRDGFYVTDRVFQRAALVLGQGKHEQRVVLDNRNFGRAPEPTTSDRPAAGRRTP